ncbi:MAG: sigma-70 family RNA polymerase sigma factor [Umezawaea sp.]
MGASDPPTAGSAPDVSDSALITGDTDEFGALFDRHAGRLHQYCARRVGSDAAQDVVSEVFCLAFKHRDRYDTGQRDALPWLYGIATNLLRRRWRQEATRYRTLARVGQVAISSEEPAQQAIDRIDATGYVRMITTTLAKMPRRQRDVLMLYALADLDYAEIATALDIPIGTVRSTLHRARKQLRKSLPDHAHPRTSEETIR